MRQIDPFWREQSMVEPSKKIEPGDVFADYKILSQLGRGGMSSVYLAMDTVMQRQVAIKILNWNDYSANRESFSRFQQEARALCAIRHPNVVVAHRFAFTESGVGYLVLDYVDGITLEEVLKKEGRLNPERAAAIFAQVCDALVNIHQENIIHRDLKPGNIMLEKAEDASDHVRIVDFGIARVTANNDLKITSTGQLVGTPLYMSPEQLQSGEIDQRSDLYSLGCVMYETLTGKPPFAFEQLLELPADSADLKPPALRKAAPDNPVSSKFEKLVLKALGIKKEDRYQNAGQMLKDLQALPECGRFRASPAAFLQAWKPRKKPASGWAKVLVVLLAVMCLIAGAFLFSGVARARAESVWVWTQGLNVQDDDARLRALRRHLAQSYARQGMDEDAIHELERLLKVMSRKSVAATPEALAEIHFQLGEVYIKSPDHLARARQNYKAAFKVHEAAVRRRQGADTDRDLLQKVLKEARFGFGAESLEYAGILTRGADQERTQGIASHDKSHFETARAWHEELLKITLGKASRECSSFTKDKNSQEQLLSLIADQDPLKQLRIACSLSDIGELYQLEGDDDKSMLCLNNALRAFDRVQSNYWTDEVKLLSRIETCANVFTLAHKYRQSESLYESTLTARKKAHDALAPEIERILATVYDRHCSAGSLANSNDLARAAVLHYQNYLRETGLEDEERYEILLWLAGCQVKQNQPAQALANYRLAKMLCEKKGSSCEKHWLEVSSCYASILDILDRNEEYADCLAEMIKYEESRQHSQSLFMAKQLMNLARVQIAHKDTVSAEKNWRKARQIIDSAKAEQKVSISEVNQLERTWHGLQKRMEKL